MKKPVMKPGRGRPRRALQSASRAPERPRRPPPPAPAAERRFRYFDLVMAGFVTVLIVSNVASSAKIIDWGVSLFGVRLAFDGGTILFPVSYIFGDVLTEVYGYRRSRRVIWTGFACLAASALVLWLVRVLPGEESWLAAGGQQAFVAVLGGMSSGGIVIASLAGYFAGEFSNSFVLAKMKILTRGRWLWMRTIGSTLVGEALDTLIFIAVASLTGVFSWSIFLTLVVTNYVFKCAIEAVMTPVTYRIVRGLKRAEREDFYDYGTDFNPFRAQA
jgi:queuosine precursor transporter